MAVADVAKLGDQRATLEAMRDALATAMDEAPDTVKAQVASQLRQVLADLRALPQAPAVQPAGVVTIADAKQRRAARQSAATAAPEPKARSRKRG
jgi:uncharacterized protein (DUF2267 family)